MNCFGEVIKFSFVNFLKNHKFGLSVGIFCFIYVKWIVFIIKGNNYFPTFSTSTMYDLTKPFPDLLGFLRQLKSPPKFRANVNTWTKQKMAGFDEGGVFFSDNFASEEQTDENQINRQQVKKRLKDFIRQFHEGNFSYTYRYIFFSRSASLSQSFPFLCCVQSKYRCQCITQ